MGNCPSSYQIEGAFTEDGKGVSIWDTFSNKPGNIAQTRMVTKPATTITAIVKILTYEKLKYSGIPLFNFMDTNLSSGIVKDSDGNVHFNKAGLDFYDNIVNCCLKMVLSLL